jgi:hypothetical protein
LEGELELSSEAEELPADGVEGVATGKVMAMEYKDIRDLRQDWRYKDE